MGLGGIAVADAEPGQRAVGAGCQVAVARNRLHREIRPARGAGDGLIGGRDLGIGGGIGGARPRRAAIKNVVARTALEAIVARIAVDRVVSGSAIDRIVAITGRDGIVTRPAVNDVVAQARVDRIVARTGADIVGISGGAAVAGGVIGIHPVAARVADIAGVDQVVAGGAIDDPVAGKGAAALEVQAINAQAVVGVKIVRGIGGEESRIARPLQQGLRRAVGKAGRRVAGVTVGIVDVVVDVFDVEVTAAGRGQHNLKAVGPAARIGRDVQPGDGDLACSGVKIPIDVAALADVGIGPERRQRRLAQRGQGCGGIGRHARLEGDQPVGADVDRAIAGAVDVDARRTEDRRDVDVDIAVILVAGNGRGLEGLLAIASGSPQSRCHCRHGRRPYRR